ncbi:MAG: HIT family protein [Firmicutes bacterium]|nr:HIT family protein [Bacillota bacterium]
MEYKDPNCAYCMGGELLAKFGIKICDLEGSVLYLFKEQSHPGRVILAAKRHVNDITDLTDAERDAFFADVNHVSKVLQQLFHPDKVNYGAYNDLGGHLHFHLVPKYRDSFEWGSVFAMNPGAILLSDEEYTILIDRIKSAL